MQVIVSLSLHIWWIASANPPYTKIRYRLNRRTAVGESNPRYVLRSQRNQTPHIGLAVISEPARGRTPVSSQDRGGLAVRQTL